MFASYPAPCGGAIGEQVSASDATHARKPWKDALSVSTNTIRVRATRVLGESGDVQQNFKRSGSCSLLKGTKYHKFSVSRQAQYLG